MRYRLRMKKQNHYGNNINYNIFNRNNYLINRYCGFTSIIKVCRQSRKTFLLLCCLFFLVYFSFISFPLSAFCDFSAICHRISIMFGQLIDDNL